ncbi:hypothetical protein MGR01S_06630 [Meiothermus granaticius NBRC 107808]|nr:hypothetical protein MGR01S_06630 [Meiothermus granaticius NBRC 107808]
MLDTTVYVAAALTEGVSHRIVKAFIDEGFFTAIVSHDLLAEIRGVLLRPRFGFTQGPVDRYLTAIFFNAELHPDVPDPPSRCKDPDDDYLLALALEANADVVVSENWDLLEVSPLEGRIPVLKAGELLRLLREGGLEG